MASVLEASKKCTFKADTSAKATVRRSQLTLKEGELNRAVDYCKENNCRGYKAISNGICPNIKDARTINARLDGKVITGKEKEYCSILTDTEEEMLIKYIIGKSRAYQPQNRSEVSSMAVKLLKVRQHVNKKLQGGRRYKKLTSPAQLCIERNKLPQSFWTRFDAKVGNRLSRKREQYTSIQRAISCTEAIGL
ncbi:Hypothetical predicted protein [Paramuricea clavata]|uniref:Uncharacterized protein n=1 Tax=Paramuricea clavata TaxID=317549 RepID=A0A6S7GIC0_PARCT|nr:Hypothetical predicted protein [Paramuricea clavata]